jgi:cobalt-zinc-cadmium efflux system protein
MSTTEVALTCHLVMPDGHPGDEFLLSTGSALKDRFGVDHPTLQVEVDAATVCPLAPEHVV